MGQIDDSALFRIPSGNESKLFTVRLPAALAPNEAKPGLVTASRSDPAQPPRRILVADVNRDSADSMAEMLRLLGNEVAVAHDGLDAVEQAGRSRPQLILMDLGMPNLNGLDATRRIRAQPWGRPVTIIAVTGWGQDNDRLRSKEAGCDGHLVKPISLDALRQMLAAPQAMGG